MNVHGSSIVFLCIGALFLLSVPPAAETLCIGDAPECVLQCYSTAYAERDSSMFAALLAPEFVHVDSTRAGGDDCDYGCTLRIISRMFQARNVQRIALEFGEPGAIEEGQSPGTWVIRNAPALLQLEGTDADGRHGPFTVRELVSLWVRRVGEPEPHFVIFGEELRDPVGQ
jgi:hypothetical protein